MEEEKKKVRKTTKKEAPKKEVKKKETSKKEAPKKVEKKTTTKKEVEKKPVAKKTTVKKTTTKKETLAKTSAISSEVKKETKKKTTTPKKTPVKKTSVVKSAPKKEESITKEIDVTELREIIKEAKKEAKIIPNLKDKEVKEAKKILDKEKIEYEDETKKKYSLTVDKGDVIKTEPEAGKLYEKDEKVVIYESKGKMLILFIILAALIVGGLSLTFGKQILDSLNEQIIEITGGIKAPEIDLSGFKDENGNIVWTKNNKLKIQKPDKRIKKYKYCIREEKSTKNCTWEETEEPIILIPGSGHLYITIIPVDENGKEGQKKEVEVYVDQNNPQVTALKVIEVTENSIKVETRATDKESGIAKYLYSLDGVNYVEDGVNHLFKDLLSNTEYRVYVKVIDEVGNETIVSIKVRTLGEGETKEEGKEEPGTNEETEDPNKWDLPQIDLEDVPSKFPYGKIYLLPSHVDFGNDTGEVKCYIDTEEKEDTVGIRVGKHIINCTATSSHGKTASVSKEVEVLIEKSEDQMEDGWLKLNLYYPEGSYDRQWILKKPGEYRTDANSWQDYTGPILVRIEDIEDIYIHGT